jgi:hypothetical protein
MIGLLLAFVLRAMGQPSDEILREGMAALVRAVVWFAAFGVISAALRSRAIPELALRLGVAVGLLALTVGDGLLFPAVAQPFWIIAALALPVTAAVPTGPRTRQAAGLVLPLLTLLAVGILYAIAFYPVAASALYLHRVHVARPQFRSEAATAKTRPQSLDAYRRYINAQLVAAVQADPLNVAPLLAQARWSGELGLLYNGPAYGDEAVKILERARQLDPLGLDPLLLEFEVRVRYAERFPATYDKHRAAAEQVLEELARRDPVEAAWLRNRLPTLSKSGQP